MISAYADALEGKLSFDRKLARSVRQEVEDHLWEAVAADASGDAAEAQRRAVARFGDPELIAAQIAAVALARQARQAGFLVMLALGGLFLAMQARLAWYELTQWGICEALMDVTETVGLVDRAAFWLAIAGAAGAGIYSAHRRLRSFLAFSTIATAAIVASVLCDGVLTALRLSGWEYSSDFLVPIFSMALEIACAAALVHHIRGAARRISLASATLETSS
jgi:hypothetical protein